MQTLRVTASNKALKGVAMTTRDGKVIERWIAVPEKPSEIPGSYFGDMETVMKMAVEYARIIEAGKIRAVWTAWQEGAEPKSRGNNRFTWIDEE